MSLDVIFGNVDVPLVKSTTIWRIFYFDIVRLFPISLLFRLFSYIYFSKISNNFYRQVSGAQEISYQSKEINAAVISNDALTKRKLYEDTIVFKIKNTIKTFRRIMRSNWNLFMFFIILLIEILHCFAINSFRFTSSHY